MAGTEYDDTQHYALFKGPGPMRTGNSYEVRWSSITLAALRAAGVFSNMVDGVTPPPADKLWLDKNFDPPLLKEWDSVGSSWEVMTFDRLFSRSTVIPLSITGGTANALVVAEPAVFQEGKLYSVMPAAANTGPVTIQVTGVGTYGVKYPNGTDIAATELYDGRPAIMIFQNGRFELLIGSAGQVASEVAQAAAAAAAASASSAAGSASTAATEADSASAAAEDAIAAAGSASTSAGNAAASASAASTSASNAAGSATAASTSATNAGNSATSANNAKTAAEAAQAAAEAAAGTVQPVEVQIHGATAKAAIADADEMGLSDSAASWGLKKFTLANLISSIFTTGRKIANANFDTSLRLWDTTDNSKGLSFDLTGIATGQTRKIIVPDGDVPLPNGEVSQADAEAGTSTTVQAWTAERVGQAINAQVPAKVGSALAALAWNGIGSTVMASSNNSPGSAGTTKAGSLLTASNAAGAGSTTLPGTWLCCGSVAASGTAGATTTSIWRRVL